MQLCGAFGSPKFDKCGPRVCILAADDRFPNCKPNEARRPPLSSRALRRRAARPVRVFEVAPIAPALLCR